MDNPTSWVIPLPSNCPSTSYNYYYPCGNLLGLMSLHKVCADFLLSFLLASMHEHTPAKLRCTQPSCAGRRGPILIVRTTTILRKACDQLQAIKLELHATGGLMPRAFSACNLYTRSAAGPRLQRDKSGN